MEQTIKVLTILNRLDMGGVEKTLLSCIPFLSPKVQLSILCNRGGILDNEFIKQGVELIDFEGNNKPFKDAIFLKRVLKDKKIDIVHSRSGHTSGNYAKVCSEMSVPLIVSIHNERAMFKNSWVNRPILSFIRSQYLSYHKSLTLKYSNKIIGHSIANLNYYTDHFNTLGIGQKYDILYNGVDFSKFKDFPSLEIRKQTELDEFRKSHDIVLIHIGSFKEQKNHKYLLDILYSISPDEKSIGLILIGAGVLENEIKNVVKNMKIDKHILFVGMETNIAPYLFSSDIFVFPSLYEGFGNVLIEAQYAKLPIWISCIKPHYEASFSAYHKYMFNPLNVEDGLAKLSDLIEDYKSGNLSEIQESAFSFAENFSVENMSNNLLSIYQEVFEQRK